MLSSCHRHARGENKTENSHRRSSSPNVQLSSSNDIGTMTIPAGAAATRCTATSTSSRPRQKRRLFLGSSLLLANFQCKQTSHTYFTAAAAAAAGGRPRSSGRSALATTALRMHRLYSRQPPHDASLYDLLGVAPNCTLREVQAAYRKRSREYHPDKARVRAARMKRNRGKRSDEGCQDDDDAEQLELEEEECKNRLVRLREAYEVLKEDQTRLPYHRFGLVDTDTAAELLTGGGGMYDGQQPGRHSAEQDTLLRLMGYEPRHHHHQHHYHHHYHHDQYHRHQRRVAYLAANLVELIRPVVEGTLSQQDLVQHILTECNEVKSSPLGAQIIRCVGRAYRHAGRKMLREHWRKVEANNPLRVGLNLSDKVSSKLRDAKQYLEAAYLSGKVVLTEKRTKLGSGIAASKSELERAVREALPALEHPLNGFGEPPRGYGAESGSEDEPPTSEELLEQEREKAQAAVLGALQVEALWKIAKIELDRTILEACGRILDGDYFFFPSYQQPLYFDTSSGGYCDDEQGWVGEGGEIIDTEVGRLRAAAAMVLVGDTMVECSKDGTSWVD